MLIMSIRRMADRRMWTAIAVAAALAAYGVPAGAAAGTARARMQGRAVDELSNRVDLIATAYDGDGTQQDPATKHADSVGEFDQLASFTDDSPAGEVRTGTGTATQTMKVVETGAHDVLEVHVAGAADGSFDDGDITDQDAPFGKGDSEFRISFEVTNVAATFSPDGVGQRVLQRHRPPGRQSVLAGDDRGARRHDRGGAHPVDVRVARQQSVPHHRGAAARPTRVHRFGDRTGVQHRAGAPRPRAGAVQPRSRGGAVRRHRDAER
jgi:hypothetical protein